MYRFAKRALLATLVAGTAGPVYSADIIEEPVVVPVAVGGWYIRGHIGMSNQFFDGLESELFPTTGYGWHDEGGFSSAPIAGGGFGYQFNDYFRGDVTVEWRGKSDFYALDWLEDENDPPAVRTNEYTAKKSELVFMANGYYDFGNFSGITPYVGAGIGASYNKISHFRDVGQITPSAGHATDAGEWNFAWALHAGLGVQATDRMTIDLGYSFLSLGDATTGELRNDDPSEPFPPAGNNGIQFNDIYSHDFKLGIRYALN